MSAAPPLLGSVVDQLGADIVSGDLAEGERFRLGDVEKRFGIPAPWPARPCVPWSTSEW